MITALQQANLVLRFLLELGMLGLVALAVWRLPRRPLARIIASAIAVLAVSVLWALVVHSGAPAPIRLAVQVALFTVAGWSLASRRRRTAAVAFLAVVLGNAALMGAWHQ